MEQIIALTLRDYTLDYEPQKRTERRPPLRFPLTSTSAVPGQGDVKSRGLHRGMKSRRPSGDAGAPSAPVRPGTTDLAW